MAIDYKKLLASEQRDLPFSYRDQDTLLYALAVGLGKDPLHQKELDYVYEGKSQKTVPTLASILTPGGFLQDCGWDYSKVLHGGQQLQLHRPLPPASDLLLNRRVVAAYDKGERKGAIICTETEARLAKDDTAMFTLASTIVARGDGGFGGSTDLPPKPYKLPERSPDMVCDLVTAKNQALLYRLCGDRNPLHADTVFARKVGFSVPILHGLCTYGIACHAILKTICDYDHTLISGFDVRFTAPVIPGDVITTEMWQDSNVVSFKCMVKARGVTVLNNGRCTIAV